MLIWMWRKQSPCVLLVRMSIAAATMENSLEEPYKLKIEIYDPEIPVSGVYPKEMKMPSQKDSCIPFT